MIVSFLERSRSSLGRLTKASARQKDTTVRKDDPVVSLTRDVSPFGKGKRKKWPASYAFALDKSCNYSRQFALVIVWRELQIALWRTKRREDRNKTRQDRSFVRISITIHARVERSLSIHGDPSRVDKIRFFLHFRFPPFLLFFFLTYLERFLRHDTC